MRVALLLSAMKQSHDTFVRQNRSLSGVSGSATARRPLVYCTELLDQPVVGLKGEHLGQIDDLVVEVRSGAIAFVILKYRDDDKRFVLPYGSIHYDAQNQCVRVDVSREVFDQTPGMTMAEGRPSTTI